MNSVTVKIRNLNVKKLVNFNTQTHLVSDTKMSKFTHFRTEEEVGILKRITDIPRFKGIFKQRFSDFHVNEIGLDGKIVQLTDLKPPAERKSNIDEDDPQICNWIPEDVRHSIKEFQRKLEDAKKSHAARSEPIWKEKVLIKVTNYGKEERTKIHKWLTNFDNLGSETKDQDGQKYIVTVYENKQNRNRRRPASRARYTHCTMYKEGVDTSEAIGLISKKLRIKPNYINFSGTKDKHGKTTQRICFNNVDAHRIAHIANELRSITLGNFEYLPHHLRLGDLKGNHFKILLKDVQAESDESITASVESLKSSGFINYFGLQRFGSYEVSTHVVGKNILQNKWIEAFDLILKPKDNDSNFMKLAKHEWFKNRDPNTAVNKFPHWHRSIESNLLHGLAKYYSKNDFIAVFQRIPRNVRHLYIHSFQSYLWNQVASFRIEKMGTTPVVGDLVYLNKEQDDFYVEDIEEESEDEDSSSQSQPKNPVRQTCGVKTLKEEDLPNYTIFDVLIPIHGTQIMIPEDSHIRSFYNDLLKKEGLNQDCFLKFKPISDQPKGAYRKLVVRPQNVSHKIISYKDSDVLDTIIPSELDKLSESIGIDFNSKDRQSQARKNSENGKEPQSAEDATETAKKGVIVEFSLPSSSYATMALREILITPETLPSLETYSSNDTLSESIIEVRSENESNEIDTEPNAKRIKLDSK